VEYESEPARDRVVAGLRDDLAAAGIPFHEIRLPADQLPAQLARGLVQELQSLDSGVVSISGFARAFPSGPELEDGLQALSYHRENLAAPPLHQIWWMPAWFAERFLRAVSDLNSWFLTRVQITEVVAPARDRAEAPTREVFTAAAARPSVPTGEARARAAELTARLERALEQGEAAGEEIHTLAEQAVSALRTAGLENEARAQELTLARRLAAAPRPVPHAGAPEFFVSYSSADRRWAVWIAWELEGAGYTTVIQAWDFLPGSNFILEMQRAAAKTRRTIAVLSPRYFESRFTPLEWAAAFARDLEGEARTLVPVRVQECELEGLLAQVDYVDLVGLDKEAARRALLQAVRAGRRRPSAALLFSEKTAAVAALCEPAFPGDLPAVWNVPHRRNPHFTGREKLLDVIHASLSSGQRTVLTLAITGLGGVGKTQLALEYAYRHNEEYRVVWWIRSEQPSTLADDFAALAVALQLPQGRAQDQSLAVDAARRWLEESRGWLLVLDNADDPAALSAYLPRRGGGHVLITSRATSWGELGASVSVDVFSRKESVQFLCERTGSRGREAAARLAEELGHLPLAIAQAAAYMEATSTSLAAYLDLFRARRRELWSKESPPAGYPDTVATTWELSLERVRRESPAAADVLHLCAYLAPDAIPRRLLSASAGAIAGPLAEAARDPVAFNEALRALRRYSLAEVDEDSLSVHRLLQAVTRDKLSEEGRKRWAEAAVGVVKAVFPVNIESEVAAWPLCAVLLDHALEAVRHAAELGTAPESVSWLLNQAGRYLQVRARFAGAKAALESALRLSEVTFGPDHAFVATVVNNLGRVLYDLGDLEAARQHFERALRIDEAATGSQDPEVAAVISNLGSVLRDLGELDEARQHFERALRIDEAAYGPEHPAVARDVSNLGSVLQELGDLEAARQHFERALRIDEAAYGPEHPEVATDVNNLGSVFRELGDLEAARQHFERALRIDEAAYGPEHPSVAIRLHNLGVVLRDLGDLEKARQCFERAFKIFRGALDENHWRTRGVREELQSLGK
jgi:tetratricopeptide (TPR) repeat protein